MLLSVILQSLVVTAVLTGMLWPAHGFPAMKRYAHLFFDLDHTLWDFEANSRDTLRELFDAELALLDRGMPNADGVHRRVRGGEPRVVAALRERAIWTKRCCACCASGTPCCASVSKDEQLAVRMGEEYIEHMSAEADS